MTLATSRGAGAYARTGLESQAVAASPTQLITLLFDGIDNAIRQAKLHMEKGNIPERGAAISRTLDIINQGLISALDFEKGGEIAQNLSSIYDYVCRCLIEANRTGSMAKLEEAQTLMNDIGSAWREMSEAHGG